MDSPRRHRGLVVLSLFRDGMPGWERWTEALIAALGSASADPSGPSSWRIIVGVADPSRGPSTAEVGAAAAAARAAGGDLMVVQVADGGSVESLAVEAGDDAGLALLIEADTLVLPTTIVRMLRAQRGDGSPVAARSLPLPDDDRACVLVGLAGIAAARASAVSCPEAVVVRDGRESARLLSGGRPDRSLLEDLMHIGTGSAVASEAVAEAFDVPGDPKLSIVMRTQLRRPEALRDVLLCLAAQTDGRFELLLVAHDAEPAGAESVLGDQPPWLRQRSRVLTASGGTRSRPLNVGFDAARGTHVAVLDDDDVVTSRWVAGFLEAAVSHPRRLLRAVVGVQRVTPEEWADGISGHAAEGDVAVPYPAAFDLADHLRVNMTPFMAIAFPRSIIGLLGGADEALEVCEDWDLVLRAAAVVGVADLPGLTAVYRRWTSGDDSYSLHDEGVWQRDMQAVRAKLDSRPLVLPPGSASALAAMSRLRADPAELAEVYRSTSWRVTAPLRAVSRAFARIRGR